MPFDFVGLEITLDGTICGFLFAEKVIHIQARNDGHAISDQIEGNERILESNPPMTLGSKVSLWECSPRRIAQ